MTHVHGDSVQPPANQPTREEGAATPHDQPAPSADGSAANASDQGQDQGISDVEEHGGPSGPEPTRFGDWERKGRCIDF